MQSSTPSSGPLPQQEPPRPGKLKIFFGYTPGVGKTAAMLRAAVYAREAGADVVLGCLGPHALPNERRLAEKLEGLPPLCARHPGAPPEFDLNGALQRHPQLMVIDGLAHENTAGCRHLKRYQDVEELLRAGVDVYTTLDVCNLESLNDVVSAITGQAVRERVPDRIFDTADQVELVDLDPDDLLKRMGLSPSEEGSRKALITLREIALRRTADRTNRSGGKLRGALSDAGEHLLICLSSAPSNAKVIRTAARMAEAFHSGFTALFVESPSSRQLDGENGRRLRANLKLAQDLGAKIATVYGEDVALQIAEYARVSGVSKIVVGRSNHKKRFFSPRKSLTDRLIQLAPNMDVYIIPDSQPPFIPARHSHQDRRRFSPKELLKVLLVVAVSTLVGGVFYAAHFNESNIITIYLLGVLLAALWTRGWLYGTAASLASVLAFNFFFAPPIFSLKTEASYYPLTFLVMLAASFITSSLTTRVKSQARQAAQKAYRTEVLLETIQKLQQAEEEEGILRATAGQLRKLLDRTVLIYPVKEGQLLDPFPFPTEGEASLADYAAGEERAAAQWVFRNNKHAGAGTSTFPTAKCLYLAVRGGQGSPLAVAGIVTGGDLHAFEKNLMLAMLDESGVMLERTLLHKAKQQMEMKAQQEALRANLLRAISHDLRTPLTSITGNAGILMENSSVLDEAKKQLLYTSIYDDAIWLISLVENLLSVTRIENGTMNIHMEPELLEDVFHEALRHLDRRSHQHQITFSLEDDLLMANMDARLMVQVLINLLNNAIKYTPSGSEIHLTARKEGTRVLVEVADNGPGISEASKSRLFEMFYTADNARGDERRGLGLGLALCKAIVNAHGGSIWVEDNHPSGAVFRFTLDSSEVSTYE